MPNRAANATRRPLRACRTCARLLPAACGAPESADDCVHSTGYWKDHPQEAQVESPTLGPVPHDCDSMHPRLTYALGEPLDRLNNGDFPCEPLVDCNGEEVIGTHTDRAWLDSDGVGGT